MVDFRIDVIVNPQGVRPGTRVVERELTKVENRADRARASVGRLFGAFAAVGLVTRSVRVIAEFDRAIRAAGTIAGATGDEFERLSQKAQELGAATRFTATEAANALTELSRGGFAVTESLIAVSDTLTLAQAGNIGLADAANTTVRAIRAFGLTADQAGDVADVLSTAANSSTQTLGDLAAAFRFAAPAAASAGLSIRDTAAALQVLADQGLSGTLGGTGLRQVLVALLAPSKEAEKALQRFGLTAQDVNPGIVGLETALATLKERGVDALNGAFEIFPARAGSAFLALTANAGAIAEARDGLEDVSGNALATAKSLDDNLEGALKRVRSAFEAVILSVGDAGATGALRGFFESLAVGLRRLAANGDQVITFVKTLTLFLGPRFLLGTIRALTAAIAANPIGLLAVVIAGVVSAIPELQAKITDLTRTIFGLGEAILGSFDFQGLLVSFAGTIDQLIGFFSGFGAAAGAVFDALSTKPDEVGELIKKGLRDALEATLKFFLATFQTIGRIITGLGSDIISLVENVGGAIGAITSGNRAAAQAFADNLESTLLRSANRVATFTGQVSGDLKKLQGIDILDPVTLTPQAAELGDQVAAEFARGYAENSGLVVGAIQDSFARGAAGAPQVPGEAGAQAGVAEDGTGSPLGDAVAGASDQVFTLQQQLDALDAKTDFGSGIARGFLRLRQEAEDLAKVGEDVANVFADQATDAILNFVETGKFSFKDFANSVVQELLRIILRLLIVQALNAAVGGAAGAVGNAAAGAASSAASSGLSGRRRGGPVQRNRSFVVGENGPEIFTPNQTGRIAPNPADAPAAAPPQINVQVVTVEDPDMVPKAIASGAADEAIIVRAGENRERFQQQLGG
jgi:TP901 family phage tail tape measure protein